MLQKTIKKFEGDNSVLLGTDLRKETKKQNKTKQNKTKTKTKPAYSNKSDMKN